MITIGIDSGSRSTKGVVVRDGEIAGTAITATGGDNRKSAQQALDGALAAAGVSSGDVARIIVTGYGRANIPFAHGHVTEITCHATGLHHVMPEIRTVLDIGGQDSKAIRISEDGKLEQFAMNDKCAAGTGRFLELIATALGVTIDEMAALSEASQSTVAISSMCAVFAESEVVSLVARGCPVPDIIRGVHEAIAQRSVALLKRVGIKAPVAMSGGVARNRGVTSCLEKKLGADIKIPPNPQFMGAFGAAIIARSKMLEGAA